MTGIANKLFAGFIILALLLALIPANLTASATASELFFSEYIEGSSYNKALEIYNGTGGVVDLSTYTLELYSNGASSPSQSTTLSGLLADGDVYVIAHSDAVALILAQADATNNSVINFNGDDAIALKNSGVFIDVIGQIGTDPGSEWGSGDASTQDNTLRRKADICAGDPNGSDAFNPSLDWEGFAKDTFDGLGAHTANCNGITPGQSLPLIENFDDCTLADWEIVSVDSDSANTWSCNAAYSNIDVSGYEDTAPADDWLITPPLNLNAQEGDTLTFRSYTNYTDSGIPYPQLQVLYSTDYNGGGDPTSATWTALSGITFSPENSGAWVDSGNVDLSGISGANVYIAFQYQSSGTSGGTAATWRLDAINIFEKLPPSGWIINEIHADPAGDISGDANGDGTRDSGQDEFVEVVNNTGKDFDISGWTLSDDDAPGITFPEGSILPDQCAVVVFGGGNPTGSFGDALVFTDDGSIGSGLSNSGDVIIFTDGATFQETASYGSEGGDNQSLTRNPDITGADPLVKHSTIPESGGALFSPGTKIDGTGFTGCQIDYMIHEIQGPGLTSPLVDKYVRIEGVVVGDFQAYGQLGGFHVQEEDVDVDTDPATSEGIFVYNYSTDVSVGDIVQVTGWVTEYDGLTEITNVTDVVIVGSGASVAQTEVSLPVASVEDLEAYEGMLVAFLQQLYISEYFNFDRYGEIVLTNDRQFQPTAIHEPDSPEAASLTEANQLSRIILDDGRSWQNPDPAMHPNGGIFDLSNLFRGGDVLQNVTGVVDYHNGYRIQPTAGASHFPVNPRTAQPDNIGGNLKVASFNVLNYFTTLGSRGADDPVEFQRQRDKIFAALAAIDADVVGLIEIENNGTAVQDLVDGLNGLVGAPTYAFIDTGLVGVDEITVAFIYKPAAVSLVGAYAVLDDLAFTDPLGYGEQKSRPTLAQTFMDNSTGGGFTVVVNHLKSKGSSCGDGDDDPMQGSCNLTRTLAAQALVDWLATDPTTSGDSDFLIIGDLNAYDKEDPIDAILAGGYTDLVYQHNGEYAYSYVYSGQLGYLDHALANQELLPEVIGTTVWHINADEPDILDYDMSYKQDAQDALYEPNAYRSSDHDPVIVGLDVVCTDDIIPTLEVSVSPDTLWPPNHKYVRVTATITASDNFDPDPDVRLVSITSNEPDNGEDDGDTVDDIVIIDDRTFDLRAERSGIGSGRIYTITYEVSDACGNTTTQSATVIVPHSMVMLYLPLVNK